MTLPRIVDLLKEELAHRVNDAPAPEPYVVNTALEEAIEHLQLLRDWNGKLARVDVYDNNGFFDKTEVKQISLNK